MLPSRQEECCYTKIKYALPVRHAFYPRTVLTQNMYVWRAIVKGYFYLLDFVEYFGHIGNKWKRKMCNIIDFSIKIGLFQLSLLLLHGILESYVHLIFKALISIHLKKRGLKNSKGCNLTLFFSVFCIRKLNHRENIKIIEVVTPSEYCYFTSNCFWNIHTRLIYVPNLPLFHSWLSGEKNIGKSILP